MSSNANYKYNIMHSLGRNVCLSPRQERGQNQASGKQTPTTCHLVLDHKYDLYGVPGIVEHHTRMDTERT